MEDKRLAAAAANGDQEAFTRLVERYRPYVYTIAFKITLNEDDALDVTQNVFVKVVEKIGAFNGRGPFRAWLATIAAREAATLARRPSRREVSMEPHTLEGVSDARHTHTTDDLRGTLDAARRRRLVEGAMARLPAQQRAVFALRLKEDMRPKEIAERLGIPAHQVRSQLHRAIAGIRRALAEKNTQGSTGKSIRKPE